MASMAVRWMAVFWAGWGGVLDVAGEMGMERHPANFGLTLGRWGVGPGPFVVLPLLGSST